MLKSKVPLSKVTEPTELNVFKNSVGFQKTSVEAKCRIFEFSNLITEQTASFVTPAIVEEKQVVSI